jgi:uncharacterized protein
MMVFGCLCAIAAEVIPKKPENHFNDYARVVSSATAQGLNTQLENFERATSSQILVAIYPKMQSDSSIDDYCVRVARAWGAGQKGTNNGAVLFVFVEDRKMSLQVGYGLEGALPDAIDKEIITYVITPYFQRGDYNGGLTAGVNAILAAAKGEYKGTGRTVADQRGHAGNQIAPLLPIIIIVALILVIWLLNSARRGGGHGWMIGSGGLGGGYSGGGFSSGGGGFSSGGSFSSGGGSFGGGGASGSW